MKVLEILQRVASLMIAEFDQYTSGNCIAVATPQLIPQLARKYVQVYYNGSSREGGEGGGLLMRRMNMGVRVYRVLRIDPFTVFEKQAAELVDEAGDITAFLHLLYDVGEGAIPLQEPVYFVSESGIRREPGSDQGVCFIDQRYSVLYASTYAQLKPVEE